MIPFQTPVKPNLNPGWLKEAAVSFCTGTVPYIEIYVRYPCRYFLNFKSPLVPENARNKYRAVGTVQQKLHNLIQITTPQNYIIRLVFGDI